MNKEKICFILYKPAVSGNIGATARAMNTMGFRELRLISPADHLNDEAKMLAHGSWQVLEEAKIYPDFESAIKDVDFIVATTAKLKNAKVDYIPSRQLSAFLREKEELCQKIAIVFGSEESGLPGNILQAANLGVTIPMSTEYPSLNLAQAVMVIAYELNAQEINPTGETVDNQDPAAWRQLQERTEWILRESGIKAGSPLFHRIMERLSFLKASDARLAHSVSSKIEALLKKNQSSLK